MVDYIGQMPAGLDRAILRILSFHEGAENAVSRFTLLMECAAHGFPESDRQVRACINMLRKNGHPICSMGGENGGYYLATTRQELDDYIQREPQARINDFAEQIKAMRNAYPQDNQMRMGV
jgi:hypothetical protein